jgi:hypothetical protein
MVRDLGSHKREDSTITTAPKLLKMSSIAMLSKGGTLLMMLRGHQNWIWLSP